MRKIRLSDTDIEFFDMEVSPSEFLFFTKHKDVFRCMWKEQGKPFWTRFIVSFRSYTVKQGVIKQMSFDSPKLNDLLDQGFINIHEQFLEGTATSARSFVEDIARLAQNHDKFPNLDSKNFAKDPFYCRETRELFRQFFGSPDQKASYLKVYILSPVYLRFGGSVCRCLKRWMDAPPIEINDDSYWTPPSPDTDIQKKESKVIMCSSCLDECGTLYFQEKLCGKNDGPKFIESWTKGDPRFNDKKNPLYNKIANPDRDWRDSLTVEDFRDFVYYSNNTYGEKCTDCLSLTNFCPVHNNNTENSDKPPDSPEKEKKKRKRKKKKKEKENDVKNEEEIEKLVNHIEGTAPLKEMPENTIGGSKSPTKETTPAPTTEGKTDDMKSQAKREIFTKKAKISDDFKYGIMPFQDKSGADLKRSVIGGFKVKRIEDERTGACEITITITAIKGESAKDRSVKFPGLEKNDDPRKINRFPLTVELLKTRMVDLPKKMEWYEGWNWCASVLNFEEEEKDLCAKPSNFTIKVTGQEEECVKRTMFKLLFYVIQRKSRPCPGWNMEDDDIVACILPDESTEFEGITICIIRGFRFEERLTDEEKASMQSPPKECIANPKKVMMTWQPSKARSILKAPAEKGRAELKELLLNVGSIVNRVDEIPENCSPQRRRQLELKIQKQMTVLKARPPRRIDEGPMYKQMKQNPDTFELFIMSDADKVEELESIGMMAVDVDIDENSSGNFCENCGQASASCQCVDQSGKRKQLPECNCVNCLKEICVGAIQGDFDHILAKDGIVKEDGQYVAKTAEQIEAEIKREHKSIQKVLSDGCKRMAIKQQADRADGIITKKIAQSYPQAKVIKIDRNASVDKTIEQIKLQTSIYKHNAKRSEKSGRKGGNSPEKGIDSDLEHELRQQRIKALENEREALRKMVLEEKEKEELGQMKRKQVIKKDHEAQAHEKLAENTKAKESEALKKKVLEEKEKEELGQMIRRQIIKKDLEAQAREKLAENTKAKEQEALKKKVLEEKEKEELGQMIRRQVIKKDLEAQAREKLAENTKAKESSKISKEQQPKDIKEDDKKEKKETLKGKDTNIVKTKDEKTVVKANKSTEANKTQEKDKDGKPKKKQIEIEIKIPMNEPGFESMEPFKLNEQWVNEHPHLLKQIIDALENTEAVNTVGSFYDKYNVKRDSPPVVKPEKKLTKAPEETKKTEKAKAAHEHHPCPCCHKQMVQVNEFGEEIKPSAPKKERKVSVSKKGLVSKEKPKLALKEKSKSPTKSELKSLVKTDQKSPAKTDPKSPVKGDAKSPLKENKNNKISPSKDETSPATKEDELSLKNVTKHEEMKTLVVEEEKKNDAKSDFGKEEAQTSAVLEENKINSLEEKDKLFSSGVKETERSYNIVKEVTSNKQGPRNDLIGKLLEEVEQKIILEEYDGMKADILLTGEPQCPCQVKAKELQKEKLKRKNQLQLEPTTTLRKELSHRLNCPQQLSAREENPSLPASRPPCLAHDPSVNMNEIIEEQLIDSFNIKRVVKLGKIITQNICTQTDNDNDGVKPPGFKERIVTSKPWTEERSKCIYEVDHDFERYLKYINFKQEVGSEAGTQAGEGVVNLKDQEEVVSDEGKQLENSKVLDQTDDAKSLRSESPEKEGLSSRLRKCANCEVTEPAPKTYMKCQKCKVEGIASARYYCGRECQVKDWTARHKKEHKEKLIN